MTATNNPTTPDTETPESPLALWTEQVQALADPAQADDAINQIYAGLMGLHEQLVATGQTEQAQKAAEAYNLALDLYNSHQQHAVVVAGGGAAIEEVVAQRQQAVGELTDLLKAINEGDEGHPKLQGWAENIRQDEYESAIYETSEGEDEYYAEIFDDNVRESINEAWEVVGQQGDFIYQALVGEFSLKKEHAQMLQRLISELPTDFAGYQAYKQAQAEEPDEADDDSDE
jgi:hypothetical protein